MGHKKESSKAKSTADAHSFGAEFCFNYWVEVQNLSPGEKADWRVRQNALNTKPNLN